MTPQRIQRKRTSGWRMPENTVYVGRGSYFGNPFPTHEPPRDGHGDVISGSKIEVRSPQQAVALFEHYINSKMQHGFLSGSEEQISKMREALALIKGKDLACWCPLDQPCHADVLLEIANA